MVSARISATGNDTEATISLTRGRDARTDRGGSNGSISRKTWPVPLTGVAITADVRSFCAKVTVTQRYVNREAQPIEAVYVFPLDEGAAVCGFEAIIDGTLVVGEVKERDEAFRMYDDAMEAGHGAYPAGRRAARRLPGERRNLPPGKEVLLEDHLCHASSTSTARRAVRRSRRQCLRGMRRRRIESASDGRMPTR